MKRAGARPGPFWGAAAKGGGVGLSETVSSHWLPGVRVTWQPPELASLTSCGCGAEVACGRPGWRAEGGKARGGGGGSSCARGGGGEMNVQCERRGGGEGGQAEEKDISVLRLYVCSLKWVERWPVPGMFHDV